MLLCPYGHTTNALEGESLDRYDAAYVDSDQYESNGAGHWADWTGVRGGSGRSRRDRSEHSRPGPQRGAAEGAARASAPAQPHAHRPVVSQRGRLLLAQRPVVRAGDWPNSCRGSAGSAMPRSSSAASGSPSSPEQIVEYTGRRFRHSRRRRAGHGRSRTGSCRTGGDFEKVPGLIWRRDGRNPRAISRPGRRSFPCRPAQRWSTTGPTFARGGQCGFETKRGCNRQCLYCADPLVEGAGPAVAKARGDRRRDRVAAGPGDRRAPHLRRGVQRSAQPRDGRLRGADPPLAWASGCGGTRTWR